MKLSHPDIIILTRDPSLWSCQQFLNFCNAKGKSVLFLNPFRQLNQKVWDLRPKIVLHRSSGVLFDDIDILLCAHWEKMGAMIFNPPSATEIFRDKSKAYFYLQERDIPQIPTFFVRGEFHFDGPIFDQGIVVKPIRGNKGIGVQIFESRKEAQSFWQSLESDQRYLIQPKIPNFRDLRIFLLDHKVLSCFYKDSPENQVEAPSLQQRSLEQSKKLGLKYCAWDWVETSKGPVLNEVNLSPGFQKLSQSGQTELLDSLLKV